jgi:APA family basic amino acid/polyamine antiporter
MTDFAAPLATPAGGVWQALAAAMVGVLWSYGGWQHATFTAAEARNPSRSIPRALILAAAIVTAVYLLTMAAYMFLLTPAQMGTSDRLATDAVGSVLGPLGAGAIALAICVSTFGTTGIYTLTAPRIYYAMATDGVFFRKVSGLHPKYGTPMYAILLQSVWAVVLILFWGTFENLISYVVFTDWIFFGLAAASVFIFRRRLPDAARPYRTTGYPFTPLVFVLLSAWFVLNTFIEKPGQAWAGLAFLALGVPVYRFWRRR